MKKARADASGLESADLVEPLIFKGGKPVANQLGAMNPADFENWIKENI